MVETDALFILGDAAEEAGNYPFALHSFERGAALGDQNCLMRLARMYDEGIGVAVDKPLAIRCFRQAWRRSKSSLAAHNLACLCREAGKRRAMFQWFQRAADQGDGDALVELAKCYLRGQGVRKSAQQAVRHLSSARFCISITEASREEAETLLEGLRPFVLARNGS